MELAGHGDEVQGGTDGVGMEAVLGRLLALALGREPLAGDPPPQVGWIHRLHDEDNIALCVRPRAAGGRALAEAGRSQILARNLGRDEDATPSLPWAGDLDRDGRLDYLLDTTDHYNVSELTPPTRRRPWGGR